MVAGFGEVWANFLAEGLPVDGVPWLARGLVGAVGLAVVLGGARLRRHGLRLGVTGAGLLLGAAVVGLAVEVPAIGSARVIVGALFVASGALLWLEALSWRAALMVVGFVAGALSGHAVQAVDPTAVPSVVPFAAGIAFGAVTPWVYEPGARFVSPVLAAPVVAWALGGGSNILALAALWAVGITVQLFTGPTFVDLAPVPDAHDWRRPR